MVLASERPHRQAASVGGDLPQYLLHLVDDDRVGAARADAPLGVGERNGEVLRPASLRHIAVTNVTIILTSLMLTLTKLSSAAMLYSN